jgi:hypothetical protein
MSQTSCRRCGLPVPMRWLRAGGDLSRPDHIHQSAERPLMRSERAPKCPTALTSRACRHRGGLVLACRPSSRPAPTLNLHSTRCQPVPNFPRLRALALFGRRPPQRVDSLLMHAGVQKPAHHRKSVDFSITSLVHSSLPKYLGSMSKRPARFSSSHNMAAIAFFGACFWVDGQKQT